MTPALLALADDTTGALEVGAKLSAGGVRNLVWLKFEAKAPEGPPAVVLDLATRHLAPEEAARRVRAAAGRARLAGVPHVYLKTDSTLRGPLGAEFRALLESWPDRPLVYVPAYPAMGRTVTEGILYVDGCPVSETAFAHDPLNPVRESSILRLLAQDCSAPLLPIRSTAELERSFEGAAGCVLVCDARDEAEMGAIATALATRASRVLVAGTGGFAGHWFARLPLPREERGALPLIRRWLLVNGSLHPRSREQAERARLPQVDADGKWPLDATWALLETPRERSGDALRMARELAAAAARVVRENGVEGLVIFGGDTARAVLEALGVESVEPWGEVMPGITVSRAAGLVLVTKAGGFGPPDIVPRLREEIERCR